MSTAETEAWEIATAEATSQDGTVDEDRRFQIYRMEYQRQIAERRARLTRDSQAVFRSMDGWARVPSSEVWREMVEKAAEDLETGSFLIDRLGAERHLDPALMAVLLVLRRRLIDEYSSGSAADIMLIDMSLMSYYHTLRISSWVGNLASVTETELFGTEGLSVVVNGKRRSAWDVTIKELRVVEIIERLSEQILPLLDRSNKMMVRNLTAVQARRQAPVPSVNIGQAGQVNVAAVQANEVGGRDGDGVTGRVFDG